MRLRCIFSPQCRRISDYKYLIHSRFISACKGGPNRIWQYLISCLFLLTCSCYRSGLCHLKGKNQKWVTEHVKSRFNDQPRSLHLSVMWIPPMYPRLIDWGFNSLDDIAKKVNLFAKTEIEFFCQRVGSATASMSCEVPFNKLDGRCGGFIFSAGVRSNADIFFFLWAVENFPMKPSRIRLKAAPCFQRQAIY